MGSVSVVGFAAAVEDFAVREHRFELLREAKWSLEEWDRHRRREDARRCYEALCELAGLLESALESVSA